MGLRENRRFFWVLAGGRSPNENPYLSLGGADTKGEWKRGGACK